MLITMTGFLVGLALTFRSTTGYERYIEGRKYWAQLTVSSHNLARIIWTHAKEREGEVGKEDLLAKM
jgi:putative membrane protein